MKKRLLILALLYLGVILAFASCADDSDDENLVYKLSDDKSFYAVVGIGEYEESHLVIPATYKGLPVKNIGVKAFKGCDWLLSVVIPSSVTSIEGLAFENCNSLSTVTFEANSQLTNIGYAAFKGCTSLKSITVPSSVTHIDAAFYGCTSLESITLPFVGWRPNAEGKQAHLGNVFGYPTKTESTKEYHYYDPETEEHFTYPIPTSLKTVVITGGTNIGFRAFGGCTELVSVEIPSSVESIDNLAFCECTSLSSVKFGPNSQLTSISFGMFYGCTSLKDITIPSSVTIIDWHAFYKCASLKDITIPSSVTSIGESAFFGCTSLKNIKVPSSVTSIGPAAFQECNSLESIEIPFVGKSPTAEGVAARFGYVFGYPRVSNSSSHYHYYDPGTKQSYVFPIPASLKNVVITGSASIGDSAFMGCDSLTSIEILSSATSIGDAAFSWCSSLSRVVLPSSVTRIGFTAFLECVSLSNIKIPASVTVIDFLTFAGCTSLTKVTFEDVAGWKVNSISIAASDLVNKSKAATYLKTTYCTYTWTKE